MRVLLYANLSTRQTSKSLRGGSWTCPVLVQGDELEFSFRFAEELEGENVETARTVDTLRAAIGKVDARPTGGTITLAVGGTPLAALTYPFTAAQLDAAYAPAIGVTEDNGSFIIENATELTITVSENCLTPTSFLRQNKWQCGTRWMHELRFQQSPVSFEDTWDAPVPVSPWIEEIQNGGTTGDLKTPEIQYLHVPPDFRGTFVLSMGAAMPETVSLGREETAGEIEEALNAIAPEGGFFTVSVAYSGAASITFDGEMLGSNYDPLTVRVVAAPDGDPTVRLSLDTQELAAALRGATEIKIPLEIEAEIEDPHDPLIVRTVTLLRQTVTILAQVVRDEDAVAQGIDWLRPPRPVNYIPFVADQVIVGSQHYIEAIAASPAVIDHNLATSNFHLTVYDDDGENLLDSAYTFVRSTANSGTLTYPGGNVTAVFTSAGPISAFQAHNHTMAQVTGLEALLTEIGGRLSNLEALAPGVGLRRSDEAAYIEQWEIPRFFEVFPLLGKVELDPEMLELKELTRAMLPKFVPALLPAVHQVSAATSLPVTGTVLDAPTGAAGVLFKNNTGVTIEIPLSSPVETEDDPYGYSYQLPANGFATHTGVNGEWYPLVQYGTESSYYARNLERTLFTDTIAANQLTAGRSMECRFAVEVQAIAANTPWHWHLVIETAQLTAQGTPTDHGSPTACTADHTTETFSATAHGLLDFDVVQIAAAVLPTGITAATDYYVIGATANTFQISATRGGTALDYTTNGTTVTFSKRVQPGGNLELDDWYAEHVSQRLVLGASPKKYTFGYRVERDAQGDLTAEQLLFGKWAAATVPESAEFAIRARLVRADVLNRVTSPRGFLAVLLLPGTEAGYIKIS